MKNTRIYILLSFLLFGLLSSVKAQEGRMDSFTVKVEGLGCPFCAYGLEKKFKELKGIKKITIEMETGILKFNYPEDRLLTLENVEAQVKKAGYTPVSVTINRSNGSVEKTTAILEKNITNGQSTTFNLFVSGNCDMCKARIELAVKNIVGVQNAEWNKDTKVLTIKAHLNISQLVIEEAISNAGHDTQNKKAQDSAYVNLPGCCQYTRKQ